MAQAILRRWLCVFVLQFSLLPLVRSSSYSFSNLSEVFPTLQDLYTRPNTSRVGGQNFTRCCLWAVSESYQIQNGQVTLTGNAFIDLTPDQLSDTQFPCGATYNGSNAGAPQVVIPYSWCSRNCGGWALSSTVVLTQWIQPFVGFILPAAVFCLNVRAPICPQL